MITHLHIHSKAHLYDYWKLRIEKKSSTSFCWGSKEQSSLFVSTAYITVVFEDQIWNAYLSNNSSLQVFDLFLIFMFSLMFTKGESFLNLIPSFLPSIPFFPLPFMFIYANHCYNSKIQKINNDHDPNDDHDPKNCFFFFLERLAWQPRSSNSNRRHLVSSHLTPHQPPKLFFFLRSLLSNLLSSLGSLDGFFPMGHHTCPFPGTLCLPYPPALTTIMLPVKWHLKTYS